MSFQTQPSTESCCIYSAQLKALAQIHNRVSRHPPSLCPPCILHPNGSSISPHISRGIKKKKRKKETNRLNDPHFHGGNCWRAQPARSQVGGRHPVKSVLCVGHCNHSASSTSPASPDVKEQRSVVLRGKHKTPTANS